MGSLFAALFFFSFPFPFFFCSKLEMNRSGKRHRPTHFDALDVPLVSRKKPLLHSGAHFTKFSVKLRKLLDQEKYAEAKLLFTEMVKSSKYDFKNLWQVILTYDLEH